jgi:plasmid segregation protein ParM
MHSIGLDIGYGYSKAMDEHKTVIFPSIVSPAVEILFQSGLEDLSNRLDHLKITLDGASFFVGEMALRQGRFTYATLDRVRTQSQEYRLLFLTALALLADSPYEEYSVVTGLPVDDFADRRLIEETLSGRFHLTLGTRDVTLTILHLTVVPQPCGAFMDLLFKDTQGTLDEQYANSQVGIIDIGFKTTDFVLIRNGEFIQKQSGSLKKGMSLIYQAAIPKLSARYPGDWILHTVEAALREGSMLSLGRRIELDPHLLVPDLAGLAKEIAAWVQGRWSGEAVDVLICTGGGSLLLDPHLKKFFPHMIVLDSPQQANVRGFYKGAWYYDG